MKRTITVMAAVSALTLTACSAPNGSEQTQLTSSSPSVTPTPGTLPAGKFALSTLSDAKITFELPTPATDPALAELEAFRQKTGGEPVSYIVADVDNRTGILLVNMYQVSAFDIEGREYTFHAVHDVLKLWEPSYGSDHVYRMPDGRVVDEDTGGARDHEASELYNANLNGADVAERAKIILASTDVDLPDEFATVSVQPSGGGEDEDAIPVQE